MGVEVGRTPCGRRLAGGGAERCPIAAMAGVEPALVAAFHHGMHGDRRPVLENAQLAGVDPDFQGALAGGVRHAVEIAADGDHAFVADAALDGRRRVARRGGQGNQMRLFLGQGRAGDALRGGVFAGVGPVVAPLGELSVEIVEIAESAGEEEVLAHIPERTLDLAPGLGAIRPAGARRRAVMAQQVDERRVVVHDALGRLPDDRGLHAVVQDLDRCAAHGRKGGDGAAQHSLQVLNGAEAPPQPAAVGQHQGEQADGANAVGILVEDHLELGEVDLGLLARRRLETALEGTAGRRTRFARKVGHGSVAAGIAQSGDLPPKTASGPTRPGDDPFAQVRLEGLQQARAWLPRPVPGGLQSASEMLAHGLPVQAGSPGDLRYAQPLVLEFVDHDDLPQFDHECAPRQSREHQAPISALPPAPPGALAAARTGDFYFGAFGEYYCGTDIEPHVARNDSGRRSNISKKLAAGTEYKASQVVRKRVEEVFGWVKTVGVMAKTRRRGLAKVDWQFTLALAACNLARMPKLLAGSNRWRENRALVGVRERKTA